MPIVEIDWSQVDFSKMPKEHEHLLMSEAARRSRARGRNRPKNLKPCPHCAELFGAEEVRSHRGSCAKNPRYVAKLAKQAARQASPEKEQAA